MKGFEIRHNDNIIKVAVKDGMITVHLYNHNGNGPVLMDGVSRIYIGGIDYARCKNYVWRDNSPIDIGDKFEIKLTEMDEFSIPDKITDEEYIKRPP